VRLLSSVKISEDKLQKIMAAQPEVEIIQVKDFTQADEKAEMLLTYGWDIKEHTVNQFPNLRWVQTLSAGVDMLPLKKLESKNITLTNVRGAHKIQMAEHVIWSMLMLVREGQVFVHQQDKKVFSAKPKIDELYGKTVCIVGAGTIGREIARKCRAFDMKVYGVSLSGKEDATFDCVASSENMGELLSISDIVVTVLPLTSKTRGCLNSEFFSYLKEGALFVNAARGPVADEKALLNALKTKKIKAAALDVFVNEPLAEDNPFWELENVFITPHIGGRTIKASDRMWDVLLENISNYPHTEKMNNIIDMEEEY